MSNASSNAATSASTARRMSIRIAIVSMVAMMVWFGWPRPDAIIRVALGGAATVTDAYGRTGPLTDTLVIGGNGARRTVRVENQDSVPHVLALFSVNAESHRDFEMPPGIYEGACSVHLAQGLLTVIVR